MAINIEGKKILQDYHLVLYKLLGITTDFVSETGEIMTLCPQEHYNPICRLICENPLGCKACRESTRLRLLECRTTGKSIIYECHAGFVDIVVPLFINDIFIGCLTSGQILKKKPTAKSFRQFIENVSYLDIEEEKLHDYFFATTVLSDSQLDAVVELISLVGNYIVESESKLLFLESVNEKNKMLAARKFIEQHYQKKLTVEQMATAVFLSESHFSHMFKQEIGISPINYLNRFRVERARELLKNTTLSITEIAYETGFQSLPHFNRIFKNLEKKPPGLCRKSRIG